MQEKTITISGKKVKFQSSAAVPRLYRIQFGRDIFKDFSKLKMSFVETTGGKGQMQVDDLEIFENIAYVMAKHADPNVPETIEDWLDNFDMFSIYEILPELLSLWNTNIKTTVKSKKQAPAPSAK